MSVINNVLKDLESRESRFTPIEIESVVTRRAQRIDMKSCLAGIAVIGLLALATWVYLRPPAVSSAGLEPVAPPPAQIEQQATPMVAPAPVIVVPEPVNQIIGLQLRESEQEMRLEFALRERVVAYLKERGENSFAYRLRNIESEIAAPTLRDNRFLTGLEIIPLENGVDILFTTRPDVLVATRQSLDAGERIWAIDLRRAVPIETAVPEAVVASAAVATVDPQDSTLAEAPVVEASSVVSRDQPTVIEQSVAVPEPVAAEVKVEINSTNPNADSDNQLDYAATLISSRRYADAEALLRNLLGGSADYQARRHLLALYAQREQSASLLRLAQESTLRYPDDAGFSSEYGRALLQQGAYHAVIDLFAGRDPLDASQHALLAAGHQRLDQHAEAIRHYELSLAREPRDPRNWIGLGISQEHSKALTAALRSYRAAARLGNLNPRLQAFVGRRVDTLQKVLN